MLRSFVRRLESERACREKQSRWIPLDRVLGSRVDVLRDVAADHSLERDHVPGSRRWERAPGTPEQHRLRGQLEEPCAEECLRHEPAGALLYTRRAMRDPQQT